MTTAALIEIAVEAGQNLFEWIAMAVGNHHADEAMARESLRAALTGALDELDDLEASLQVHKAAADALLDAAKKDPQS